MLRSRREMSSIEPIAARSAQTKQVLQIIFLGIYFYIARHVNNHYVFHLFHTDVIYVYKQI